MKNTIRAKTLSMKFRLKATQQYISVVGIYLENFCIFYSTELAIISSKVKSESSYLYLEHFIRWNLKTLKQPFLITIFIPRC